MAKTCGNCRRSVTSPDYLPIDNIDNGECWCLVKNELFLCEKSGCEKWNGDIKLPKEK